MEFGECHEPPNAASGLRRRLRLVVVTLMVCIATTFQAALPAGSAQAKPTKAQMQKAQSWYRQFLADLHPLGPALVSGLQAASQWQKGAVTAAAAGSAMDESAAGLTGVLGKVEELRPLSGEKGAFADYVDALNLYLEAFLVEDAATQLPAGELVTQLQRSFERIRRLGDLSYDEGTAQLAPLLGPTVAGADVRAARALPDWISLGLAPGQPLESSWIGSRAQPAGTQSPKSWAVAVRADGAPPPSALRSAVRHPATTRQLSKIARALQQAEVRLATVPGPRGGPETSALVRLGLLVDTEAALVAEASGIAGLAPNAELAGVASTLASIGAGLRAGAGTP